MIGKVFAYFGGACAVCLLGFALLVISGVNQSQRQASIINGPAYVAQHAAAENKVLPVNVTDFLAAYQDNEEAANAKYENREVEITGRLSGVFIPPLATQLRVAGEGHHADAFMTMGGPIPNSATETMFLPGVVAYSDENSLFGITNPDVADSSLRTGTIVTLSCKCGSAVHALSALYSTKYSVHLEDCKFKKVEEILPAQTTKNYIEEARRIYPLMDKEYRDHPGPINQLSEPETQANDNISISVPSNGIYRIGGDVSAPVVIYQAEPEFSAEARKAKLAGNVLVALVVDTKGAPQNVRVIKSLGMGLDEKAIEAVQQYRFKPAIQQGVPVPVALNIEVNFQIF